MLFVLLYAAASNNAEAVGILGPTHGVLYLVLVLSLASTVRLRWWTWWFVGAVAILGPFASVPGLEIARGRQRRIR